MKFVVLALCVCYASAASLGAYTPWQSQQQVANRQWQSQGAYKPYQQAAKAVAQVSYEPAAPAVSTYQQATKVASQAAYKPFGSAAGSYQQATKAVSQASYQPAVSTYQGTRAVAQASSKPYSPAVAPYQQAAKAVAQASYKPSSYEASAYKAPVAAAQPAAPVVKTVSNSKDEKDAFIVRAESTINDDGYNYFYETGNGIAAQSSGVLKKVDDKDVIISQGSYQYVAPDGRLVKFSYIADENGYQPQSDFLPVGPPIPDEILRSIEFIRSQQKKSADKYY